MKPIFGDQNLSPNQPEKYLAGSNQKNYKDMLINLEQKRMRNRTRGRTCDSARHSQIKGAIRLYQHHPYTLVRLNIR